MEFNFPPEKKVRVIVNTDAANEADDQFAIVHALLTPSFELHGLVPAHFGARVPDSLRASRDEVDKLLRLMALTGQTQVEATARYGEVEADEPGRWRDGPRGLGPEPGAGEWGALGAWAWALRRAMDYLKTDKRINAKRVALFGFSRLGKAALPIDGHELAALIAPRPLLILSGAEDDWSDPEGEF